MEILKGAILYGNTMAGGGVFMRTKHLFKLISILFLCLVFFMSYAQKEETIESLSKKIEILEKQRDDLKELYKEHKEFLEDKFNNKSKELDNEHDYLKTLAWIIGPVTVIGIVGILFSLICSYFKLKKRIEKIALEKINEKFDQILDEKETQIIGIIEKHDKENKLKREKKILVLTPNGADDTSIRKFFNSMEFDKVSYASPDNTRKLNKVDLVFFNNEEKKFGHDEITAIAEKTKKDVFCFYFAPKDCPYNNDNLKDRLSFANARVQLYGNLINALRYQKLL
jgi:hypothetical protein